MSRVVIFGKSGSGKSWYTGQKIAEILEPDDPEDEFGRAIHLDLEDEERGLSLKGDALLLTFDVDTDVLKGQIVVDQDDPPGFIPDEELKDGPIIALPKFVFYNNDYIRVVPDGLDDDEKSALVEMLADASMIAGDTHFSMDEAHRIANQGDMGPRLNEVITGGRKRGVEWAFITQRPVLIHKTIIAQADTGVFFKLTSDRDIKKADKLAESFDAEDTLPELPNRTAIVEDYDSGEAVQINTEELERKYPHVAGDDGKADGTWEDGGDPVGSKDEIATEDSSDQEVDDE